MAESTIRTRKVFRLRTCRQSLCGKQYQPVTWLKYRVAGYCSKDCLPVPMLKAMYPDEKHKGKG